VSRDFELGRTFKFSGERKCHTGVDVAIYRKPENPYYCLSVLTLLTSVVFRRARERLLELPNDVYMIAIL